MPLFSRLPQRESAADDTFYDQMVGRASYADSDAKVEFPFWRHIEVNRRKEVLLLLTKRIEAAEIPVIAVILESSGNLLGHVVAELEIRRELHAFADAWAMPGAIECGVERQIPVPELLIHDGTNLPCPSVGRKARPLITDLVREAHSHRPIPLFWNTYPGSYMIANPLISESAARTGKNVKTCLEPVSESLRDLDRFMQRMGGWLSSIISKAAIRYRLRS